MLLLLLYFSFLVVLSLSVDFSFLFFFVVSLKFSYIYGCISSKIYVQKSLAQRNDWNKMRSSAQKFCCFRFIHYINLKSNLRMRERVSVCGKFAWIMTLIKSSTNAIIYIVYKFEYIVDTSSNDSSKVFCMWIWKKKKKRRMLKSRSHFMALSLK